MSQVDDRPVPRRTPRAARDEHVDPIDVSAAAATVGQQSVLEPGGRVAVPASPPPDTSPMPANAPEQADAQGQQAQRAGRVQSQQDRATITLNVRISTEVDRLVSSAMALSGDTKRAVVERALRQVYGDGRQR